MRNIILAIPLLLLSTVAFADERDLYAPDIDLWYASLAQPDNGGPCCDRGDAYYADKTDECRPTDSSLPDFEACALVAIVTDTRPDEFTTQSGKKITRQHVPVGTRVVVPTFKLRKPPIANPTDHNVIFINPYRLADGTYTTCWEPVAGL